jgi:hypothetical protein
MMTSTQNQTEKNLNFNEIPQEQLISAILREIIPSVLSGQSLQGSSLEYKRVLGFLRFVDPNQAKDLFPNLKKCDFIHRLNWDEQTWENLWKNPKIFGISKYYVGQALINISGSSEILHRPLLEQAQRISTHFEQVRKESSDIVRMNMNVEPSEGPSDIQIPTSLMQITKPEILELSENEIAFDIFLLRIKQRVMYLEGLYRDGIIKKLTRMGFYKRSHANNMYCFIREIANVISEVEPYQMKDQILHELKNSYHGATMINHGEITVSLKAEKLIEVFLRQSHLIFNSTFLEHLETHSKPILKDNKTEAFFLFSNLIVKVSAETINYLDYSELTEKCIWKTHILNRSFVPTEYQGGHFDLFVQNICNKEVDRIKSIKSALGYLLHSYSHPSQGQAVIAYDEQITDIKNPMGGTGKGVLQQALSYFRKVVKIDGKKFDERDKFCFQEVDERTQVVVFDDVRAELGFDRFHSILTEGWSIEKKMKPSFSIPPEHSPKVYITSNAIIKGDGTTTSRRQFIIELSPFYSDLLKQQVEPIRHTHGCHFFSSDWNEHDWNMFDAYMINSVKFYLFSGLQGYQHRSLKSNKLRQSTSEDFFEWISDLDTVLIEEFDLHEKYLDFKRIYYGEDSDFHQRTFTKWIKEYAKSKDLTLSIRNSNGTRKAILK